MGVRRRFGGGFTKRPLKGPLWDDSVIDFGSQNGGPIEVKIDRKITSFLKRFLVSLFEQIWWIWTSILEYFLILFCIFFGTCVFFDFWRTSHTICILLKVRGLQISRKVYLKITMNLTELFGSLFHRFLSIWTSILGAFCLPNRCGNRSKKRHSKKSD